MDEATQKQQDLSIRFNALSTAIDMNRDKDGNALSVDKVLADATKINAWVNGKPVGVVAN